MSEYLISLARPAGLPTVTHMLYLLSGRAEAERKDHPADLLALTDAAKLLLMTYFGPSFPAGYDVSNLEACRLGFMSYYKHDKAYRSIAAKVAAGIPPAPTGGNSPVEESTNNGEQRNHGHGRGLGRASDPEPQPDGRGDQVRAGGPARRHVAVGGSNRGLGGVGVSDLPPSGDRDEGLVVSAEGSALEGRGGNPPPLFAESIEAAILFDETTAAERLITLWLSPTATLDDLNLTDRILRKATVKRLIPQPALRFGGLNSWL